MGPGIECSEGGRGLDRGFLYTESTKRLRGGGWVVARLHGILRGAYPPPVGNPLWSRVGFGNGVCDFSEGRFDGTRLQEGIPDVSWDGGAAGAAECAQQGAAGGGVEKGESERGRSSQAVEQGWDERAEESPGGVSPDESQEGIEVMPMVGGKKYPYTKRGMRAAAAAKAKAKKADKKNTSRKRR